MMYDHNFMNFFQLPEFDSDLFHYPNILNLCTSSKLAERFSVHYDRFNRYGREQHRVLKKDLRIKGHLSI